MVFCILHYIMIQEDNTKAMGQFRIFKVPSELETNFNNSKLAFND